jgi:hypothetical protein
MSQPLPNSLQFSLYRPLFDDPCWSTTELTVSLCMQQWRYGSTHLKFDSRFMPQLFYPLGKKPPLFPLNRCWVGPEPVWALCRTAKYQSTVPARSLITTATELPRPRPCLKALQCDCTQCRPSAVQWAGPSLEDWMAWLLFLLFCCVLVNKFLLRTVCCR